MGESYIVGGTVVDRTRKHFNWKINFILNAENLIAHRGCWLKSFSSSAHNFTRTHTHTHAYIVFNFYELRLRLITPNIKCAFLSFSLCLMFVRSVSSFTVVGINHVNCIVTSNGIFLPYRTLLPVHIVLQNLCSIVLNDLRLAFQRNGHGTDQTH